VFQRLPKECKYLVTLSLVISIHGAWPHSLTSLRESTFLLERNDPPDAVQGYARKILHPSTFVNFEEPSFGCRKSISKEPVVTKESNASTAAQATTKDDDDPGTAAHI